MDLMPQHNHHCWITFMGLNWSIVGCAPNLIHIRCMMGGAEVISAIDTRAVDWTAYVAAALAMDYQRAKCLN